MFSPLVIALNQKAKCQTNRLPGVKASGKQIIWIKKLTKNRIKKLNAKQIEYFAWYTYLSHLASTLCMVVASTASWGPAALASIERLSSSAPRTSEPRIHLAWRRARSDWCVHPQTTSQDKEYYDWELCVPTLCLQPPPFYNSKLGDHHFQKISGASLRSQWDGLCRCRQRRRRPTTKDCLRAASCRTQPQGPAVGRYLLGKTTNKAWLKFKLCITKK